MQTNSEKNSSEKPSLVYGISKESFKFINPFYANYLAWFLDKGYREIFGKRYKLLQNTHTVWTPSTLSATLKDLRDCRVIEFKARTHNYGDYSIDEKLSTLSYFLDGENVFNYLSEQLRIEKKNLFRVNHVGEMNAFHIFFSDKETEDLKFEDLEFIVESGIKKGEFHDEQNL